MNRKQVKNLGLEQIKANIASGRQTLLQSDLKLITNRSS